MGATTTIPLSRKLFLPDVPSSYEGRIYFILGPGLGDTVNSLRIFHEVMRRFPRAEAVVYADPRWQDLYPLIPELSSAQICFYEAAPSANRREKGFQKPFYTTFEGVARHIARETSRDSGFVAIAGFKLPDQLARKEANITAMARAIGLSLDVESCRPYLPLPETWHIRSQQFLQTRGLAPGGYLAVSPHTWPDKMWDHKSWEDLLSELYDLAGLPALVLGVHGYPQVRGPSVREALDLPLPLVAALISQSRCYIGLDTGTTHLAAAFDVPLVTLNPQGKYPPFMIEVQSPFRWTILTPGIYGTRAISVASVSAVMRKALTDPSPPACPLCKDCPYVFGANTENILYLCRCGLLFRNERKPSCQDWQSHSSGEKGELPRLVADVATLYPSVGESGEARLLGSEGPWELIFQHHDPVGLDPENLLNDTSSREVWWTWDAAYRFATQHGWCVVGSQVSVEGRDPHASFSIRMKVHPGSFHQGDQLLSVPWGNRIIGLRRSAYERWAAWGCFRNAEELEGLGWRLAQEGDWRLGLEILFLALRVSPRWKTFSRIVRSLIQAFVKTQR